jgi:radical SAM superfamily enzyme YgiQ (UPF0313 family)
MTNNSIDILFLDGLEFRHLNPTPTFLGFLFPIASVLEENMFNFKILNLSTLKEYHKNGLIEELKKHSFKTIGMTTNSDNIRHVYKISEIIKREFPEVSIIVGGPQATYSSEKILSESAIDVVVRHDGEFKLIKLLEYFIQSKGILHEIKGITFKNNNDIIYNDDDIPININTLSIPQYKILTDINYWIVPEKCVYDEFDHFLNKVKLNQTFVASRGCPYHCTFCVEGNNLNKQRTRSVEKIIEDIKYFIQVTGLKYIAIGDDTFTNAPERVKELCKAIKKLREDYDFTWFAEGRVNILAKYPELLKIMVDAGLYKLQLGIESGNPKVLNAYNKKITVDQIRTVVKEASKFKNLLLHGNLILGNPYESFSDFKISVEFAKNLIALSGYKMDIGNCYLTPFVGTDIRNNPEKYNLQILYKDFEFHRIGFIEPICKPDEMTVSELSILPSYTHNELLNFVRKNIFNLDKETIDGQIQFYSENKETPIFWAKAFYTLVQMRRYYMLFGQKTTLKGYELYEDDINEIKNCIPIRLWDINYKLENDSYYFQSLKGEIIEIREKNKEFWELASGKNTLQNIVKRVYLEPNDENVLEAFKFYRILEDNFALIFKKY